MSDALVAACRAHADSRGSKNSRVIYHHDLDQWLRWADANKVDITDPELGQVAAFRDHLLEHQAALTVRRTLASLSGMYQTALSRRDPLARWNPFAAKALPRPSSDDYVRTEAISIEDVDKIIAAAASDDSRIGRRDEALLRILSTTGLRRRSVAHLRRDDLFERDGRLVAGVMVKGGKRREAPIIEEAAHALSAWLEVAPDSPFVFPAFRGHGPMHPDTVNKIVNDRARAAGIANAHPHSFRAAFATEALDAGVPLHEVQAAMHHSNPATTQRYDRGRRGGDVAALLAKHRSKKT